MAGAPGGLSLTALTLPRDLHPVAWWGWAVGLAAAASMTTNPFLLLLLAGAATVVVLARRSHHPWGRSFRLYAWLALAIVVIRVVFRIVLGGVELGTVILWLPEIPLPDWVAGVRLLGPVTLESVLGGLYDGMRLATIVLCVGAANSLANPKRLLASLPPALHEVGTALVVAVTIFPQLADSARRVRAARALRGGDERRVAGVRRLLVPVLEDALDRSLALAAGMDTRGYGRSAGASPAQRRVTGGLLLAGLLGLAAGTYGLLDPTAPAWLAGPMLVLGVVVAVVGLATAGRRVVRSRYRPDRWTWVETLTVGTGVAAAVLVQRAGAADVDAVHPLVDQLPYLTVPALVAGVVAVLPALLTPPPVGPPAPARPAPSVEAVA